MSKWISVSSRLPEEGQRVQAQTRPPKRRMIRGEFREGKFFDTDDQEAVANVDRWREAKGNMGEDPKPVAESGPEAENPTEGPERPRPPADKTPGPPKRFDPDFHDPVISYPNRQPDPGEVTPTPP